jgi:hypothetical protein
MQRRIMYDFDIRDTGDQWHGAGVTYEIYNANNGATVEEGTARTIGQAYDICFKRVDQLEG